MKTTEKFYNLNASFHWPFHLFDFIDCQLKSEYLRNVEALLRGKVDVMVYKLDVDRVILGQ